MSHESSTEVRNVLSTLVYPLPFALNVTTPRLQVLGIQLSHISFVKRLR